MQEQQEAAAGSRAVQPRNDSQLGEMLVALAVTLTTPGLVQRLRMAKTKTKKGKPEKNTLHVCKRYDYH